MKKGENRMLPLGKGGRGTNVSAVTWPRKVSNLLKSKAQNVLLTTPILEVDFGAKRG